MYCFQSFSIMCALFSHFLLECGFGPNSIPKASSLGEGPPPLIHSMLALFLADVRLGFSPILSLKLFV
ncbi:hypothetical protein GLYMA_15G272450v4 [Glycine max]|nr:hypothetical protein GLYMA_15G272450v4 [Glycine max]KAH1149095.1 hypothetical protein GYH30_043620 [Glycine max]